MKRTAPRAAAKKTGAATKKAGARAKRAGVEGKKTGAAEVARLAKALAAAEAERDQALAREAAAGERQAATTDILHAITAAPGEAEATLRKICETTARLFGAPGVALRIAEGDEYTLFIGVGRGAEEVTESLLGRTVDRHPVRARTLPGAVIRENRQVHIPDLDHPDPEIADWPGLPILRAAGIRTVVGTPLRREGRAIGALQVYRDALQPFDAAELHLLQSFAGQAVIAIENARLLSELRGSLERQTATSEVLGVISASPGELQPVFETMLANATRLCEAPMGWLFLRDGDAFGPAATVGVPADLAEKFRGWQPHPAGSPARALATKTTVHVHDVRTDPTYQMGVESTVRATDEGGMRSALCVPLVRENEAIGIFVLYRPEVMPFSDKQIELVENFAKQAVIAIENARLLTELREALARQTAMAEVLSVISSSPGELQPVFDAMLRNAMHICEAHMGFILRLEHDVFIPMAQSGVPPAFAEYLRQSPPVQLGPGSAVLRMAQSKATVQVPDAADLPNYRERASYAVALVELGRARTTLFVPMLREGEVIGSFTIYRPEVRPFDAKQVALVENLADQAMIAIENARLLGEIKEALANQTASAEVLRTIAGTPAEAGRALDTIAEVAARLFDAASVNVLRLDGNVLRHAASFGRLADRMRAGVPEIALDPNSASGVALLERRQLAFDDFADPEVVRRFPSTMAAAVKIAPNGGSEAVTPLLREGQAAGAIVALRDVVRPFTEKELAQLRNFADQAVIAIENARLLNEIREALERQTATAEILRVIASTPGDAQRALDTIAETTARLFAGTDSMIVTVESDRLHHAAVAGTASTHVVFEGRDLPLDSNSLPSLVVRECRQIHVPDLDHVDPSISAHSPGLVPLRATGRHVVLGTPLMREGRAIGALMITRSEAKPFDEQELAQVANFADQAVIAIENARLLSELRESLDRQTAMAEVLGVISASPGEMRPVFEAILANATRLCEATQGICFTYDGARFHIAASLNVPPGFADRSDAGFAMPPESNLGRMAASGEPVQDFDLAASPSYRNRLPAAVLAVEVAGVRTALHVPLIKDGAVVGAIIVYRNEVRAFDEKHVALVQNFAAQAVIAIENARLLNEIREALERQTATAEILRVIASTPGDSQRALDTIAETTARLFAGADSSILTVEGDRLRHAAFVGAASTPLLAEAGRDLPLDSSNLPSAVVLECRQIHVPDIDHVDPSLFAHSPGFAPLRATGRHVVLGTPLMREGRAIGALMITRSEAKPFDEQELTQVANFADQAVIAIENARLLNELRESLERQTAMSEVLRVISSSPGELDPVFQAIVANAANICETELSSLQLHDGQNFKLAALHGVMPAADIEWRARHPQGFSGGPRTITGQVAATRRTVHIIDYSLSEAYGERDPLAVASVEHLGIRTVLGVPMVKDDRFLGLITVFRQEVRPFTEKQIELVENFAAQAVIAIENARLLNELRESLDRQTATAEILRAIASTPGDPKRALDTIAETAVRMFDASSVGIRRLEGDMLRSICAAGTAANAGRSQIPDIPLAQAFGLGRSVKERRQIEVDDLAAFDGAASEPAQLMLQRGIRTAAYTPLLQEGQAIGVMAVLRRGVRPFRPDELELMRGFADQAVIAIENARLLNELRARTDELARRQAELRVTFDNMGDGVIMFDGEHRLVSWNRNLQQILDLPDPFFAEPRTFHDYITYLIERGEFGAVDLETELRRYADTGTRPRRVERTRPDGRVLEVRNNPVPGGGFVTIYSDVTERTRAEEQIRAARDAAEKALGELKAAQANLIQAEKMASLGQLTAGIAHEIKNPLNFVNNFAGLSVELLDELKEAAQDAIAALDEQRRAEIDEVVTMLTSNLEKIAEHGRRADGIVKSMLAHSRGSSGERQSVNINALVEESLNLAYHGARAQDQNFNVTLERDLDAALAPIEVVPQDMTRVFLNLFGNGFYAANKRRAAANDAGFKPVLKVTTRERDGEVVISIRDNGIGIPPEIREKLFEPFFTTKPTGEGTGLGLSISYEIVTQQHGGTIEVESEVGAFTEFTVRLPRRTGAQV